MPGDVRILAHRGAHGEHTPENTLAAFERAVALGADGCELDVRRARDGGLVIFHDPTVGGTPLNLLEREEIAARAGHPVPTLAEVLVWAGERATALDVELKEDGYVEEVVEALSRFARGGGSLLVTSFLDAVIARVGELAPELARGLLIGVTSLRAVRRARRCGAGALVVQARLASDELLTAARGAGLELIVWDVLASGRRHARFLGDARVSGVITDDVAWALAERDRGRLAG